MAYNEHGQELGTSAAATATITFSDSDGGGSIDYNQTITIISTDGTSITYTTKADSDYSENEFDADGGFDDKAAALKGAIEHADGHNGKITVQDGAHGVLVLTQAVAGFVGNTTIAENITDCTVVSFSGGTEPDQFHEREVTERTGDPHEEHTGDFTMNHFKNMTAHYRHKSIPQIPFSLTMVPIRDPRVVAAPLTSDNDVV